MSCFYCPYYGMTPGVFRAFDIETLRRHLGQDIYVFTNDYTYFGKLIKVHDNGAVLIQSPGGLISYVGNEIITGIAPVYGPGGFGQPGGGFGGGGFGVGVFGAGGFGF